MKRELHTTVEVFGKELSYIKDNIIREMTAFAIEHINSNFFTEAASSTGKYHPEYALGLGGLYRHTQAAVKIANDLLQLDMYKNEFSDYVKDYIIVALILHDCCKRGICWDEKYTVHEHPILVREWLNKIFASDLCSTIERVREITKEYIDAVSNLIETHMGQWNKNKYSKVELPIPRLAPQKFVHLCDYLASRKWLEVKLNQDDD